VRETDKRNNMKTPFFHSPVQNPHKKAHMMWQKKGERECMTYRDTAYLKSHLELNNFFNSDLMCNKILKVRIYCGGEV
jgi:hypothetical protein